MATAEPTTADLRRHGTGAFADARCARCCGYGVLTLDGGPSWVPCTTCVWPGLTIEEAWKRMRVTAETNEEQCPACGGRGWHTAGGNDPSACGRCPAGEAWASASEGQEA